jgi:hypothetical protein
MLKMLILIQVLVKSFNLNISTKSQHDPSIFHHSPCIKKKIPKDHIQVFSIQEVTNFNQDEIQTYK